jgi:phosphatidate cytidylyltransferase
VPVFLVATRLDLALDGAWLWRGAALFAFLVVVLAASMAADRPSAARAGSSVLAAVYIVVAGSLLYAFRLREDGLRLVLYVVGIAKVADNGALFIGRAFGRRKLWERVSPNKTVAGFWGGMAAGTLFAVAFAPLLAGGRLGAPGALLFGALLSVFAAFGDLVESMFKREAGVKDSGGCIGGLGGFLDVMDSILLAAPAAWLMLRVLPVP